MEEELEVAVDTPVSPIDINAHDFGKKREYFSDSKSKLKCRAALSFMEVKSIVAASFGDNERRCYKVHWKDSWIYEDHLFGCEEIITEFWKRRENVKEHTRNLSVDGNDGLNNIFVTSDKDEDEPTSSELTVIVLREDHSESSNGIAEKGNEGEINVLPDMHNHHGSNSNAMKIAWEEDDTKVIHKRNAFEAVEDGKENQVAWEDEDIGLKVNLGHKRRDILHAIYAVIVLTWCQLSGDTTTPITLETNLLLVIPVENVLIGKKTSAVISAYIQVTVAIFAITAIKGILTRLD